MGAASCRRALAAREARGEVSMSPAITINTLQGRIHNLLHTRPNGRAIAFYDEQGRFEWYTVEQFYLRAERAAANLADQGLAKGEIALIVLPSGEPSATVFYGGLLIGAVPLLVAPPVVQGAGAFSNLALVLEHIIRKTRPKLVVCDRRLATVEEKFTPRRGSPHFVLAEEVLSGDTGRTPPLARPAESDIAAMCLTSGTTGMPRVCVWRQEAVSACLDGTMLAMKIRDDDACLNWTPLYHDMGLVPNFLLCMTSGVPLVMLSAVDFIKRPALWLRGLADTGATLTWSPNFGFAITTQRARESEIEGVRLDGVRGFYSGAERVHYQTMVDFHKRFARYGLQLDALKVAYGCAENVSGISFSDPEGSIRVEQIDSSSMLSRRVARMVPQGSSRSKTMTVVGVGRPLTRMSISILNRSGRRLPDGSVGEISLRSPSRMAGYLKDARANRRAISGEYLRTGDLGYMRDGELFWVGRVRERITVRSVKLDPSDFEPILLHIPDLRSGCFVAFGVDDERQGTQRLIIASEVRDASIRPADLISAEIRQQVFERLGVSVSEVILVRQGTLAKTSSGKRRHKHFLQHYLDGRLHEHLWAPDGEGTPDGIAG